MSWKTKFASRKFWVAIITGGVMIANALFDLNWDTEQMLAVVLPAIAYIMGEAWVDNTRIKNGNGAKPPSPSAIVASPPEQLSGLNKAIADLNRINAEYRIGHLKLEEAKAAVDAWRKTYPDYLMLAPPGFPGI